MPHVEESWPEGPGGIIGSPPTQGYASRVTCKGTTGRNFGKMQSKGNNDLDGRLCAAVTCRHVLQCLMRDNSAYWETWGFFDNCITGTYRKLKRCCLRPESDRGIEVFWLSNVIRPFWR